MRKISSGVSKSNLAYSLVLKKHSLDRVSATIPPRLMSFFGMRLGERLKVSAKRGCITFEQRRVSSTIFKTPQGGAKVQIGSGLSAGLRQSFGSSENHLLA